jgi:hypothetical protein
MVPRSPTGLLGSGSVEGLLADPVSADGACRGWFNQLVAEPSPVERLDESDRVGAAKAVTESDSMCVGVFEESVATTEFLLTGMLS